MRIYFTANKTGLAKNGGKLERDYKNIVTVLKEMGHEVDDELLFNSTHKPFTRLLYKENQDTIKRIRKAEVVIIETSLSEFELGWELSLSIGERKPVLLLVKDAYMKNFKKDKSLLSNLIEIKAYNSKTLKNILRAFIHYAKGKLDTKFILIISPEIDRYLEWAADNKRMHKAQIVRNAVDKQRRDDRDYLQYLQGPGDRRQTS